MLKSGDRVRINATDEAGTVKQVHPHEIVVSVAVADGHSLDNLNESATSPPLVAGPDIDQAAVEHSTLNLGSLGPSLRPTKGRR